MQNFGGKTKSIMVFLKVAYSRMKIRVLPENREKTKVKCAVTLRRKTYSRN